MADSEKVKREGACRNVSKSTLTFYHLAQPVSVLKFVMPLAGPWMGGMSTPDYEDLIEKDRERMSALVEKLPEYEKRNDMEPAHEVDLTAETIHVSGAVLRAVRALLDKTDPRHHWGGLDLVFTPEGHHLWLCEHHKAEYKA